MKWITREHVKVDRVACPWLIKKFVDRDAEFIFVPADKVVDEAKRLNATLYDVKNVELGHHGKECSFEAILKKYKLSDDPALLLLGKIVNGADTLTKTAEGPQPTWSRSPARRRRSKGHRDASLSSVYFAGRQRRHVRRDASRRRGALQAGVVVTGCSHFRAAELAKDVERRARCRCIAVLDQLRPIRDRIHPPQGDRA